MIWTSIAFVVGAAIGYLVGRHLNMSGQMDRMFQRRLEQMEKVRRSWDSFEQSGNQEHFEHVMLKHRKH